ncbi:MAG: hypothetical protein KDA96_29595, partial [Planctomycetaceae bacterium]|nr:hypothetical protein [Planctomycetaceae bacterium]
MLSGCISYWGTPHSSLRPRRVSLRDDRVSLRDDDVSERGSGDGKVPWRTASFETPTADVRVL